ncbi:hypothetical protein ABS872_16345 [Photorhabdus laumondii]|uniref:hypothetical protein n=1 Tax=Photorhabdus laumondii TaxID=2218628 RepID=UPI00331610CF
MPFKTGGNSGDGGSNDMFEIRVKKLKDDLNLIKTDLAVMKANYATKEGFL